MVLILKTSNVGHVPAYPHAQWQCSMASTSMAFSFITWRTTPGSSWPARVPVRRLSRRSGLGLSSMRLAGSGGSKSIGTCASPVDGPHSCWGRTSLKENQMGAERFYIYRCGKTDACAVTATKGEPRLPRSLCPTKWQFWMQVRRLQRLYLRRCDR